MYPPPHAYAPVHPVRRWWQHPALIITALVLLPPAGIALAWTSRWSRTQKIVATVLSGVWFLIFMLSDPPKEPVDDAKPAAAATATASPSPTSTASPSPTPTPSAEPVMPAVVGKPFAEAKKAVEALVKGELTARSAYADVPLPANHTTWLVCFQSLGAGTRLGANAAGADVHLVAPGTACPASVGATLRPKPKPTPTETDDDANGTGSGSTSSSGSSTTGGGSSGTGGGSSGTGGGSSSTGGGSSSTTGGSSSGDGSASSTGGASVSYRNCAAVRAAGAAPIRRGDPGYGSHLDRDGDGIACE
ncbi:excalibur calcium-binding domain-containing protein [Streptomyces sp. NPDC051000]|uniref:excalibur calcium-binding domain-containing protein n=1 Tax=Streptomyces sp. NPDC051000 TaxID=3155520 RepID=UPI0033C5B26A